METLKDFEISEIFNGKVFKGIGEITKVTRDGNISIFETSTHQIHVEDIGGAALKVSLNPEKLKKELIVSHNNPSFSRLDHEYSHELPAQGHKFQLRVRREGELVFSTYAPGEQLGFLNMGDEFYEMFTVDNEKGFTTISFRIPTEYGIYGLGENFTTFNKRGKLLYTFPTDNFLLNAQQVYKGIPFFLSNAGIGIVFPHYEPIKFDLGSSMDGLFLVTVPASSVTFYILLGLPEEIIRSFNSIFEKPVMPPDWSFGLWWSRWAGIGPMSLRDVEDTVDHFNRERIPLDVVVLDPQWIRDYIAGVTQSCSFDWDHEKFKTDYEVGDYLQSKGKKLALWINPYEEFYGTGFEKLKQCLLLDKDNETAIVPIQDRNPNKPVRGMVDFSRPECSDIYSNLVADLMIRSNAQTVISDFGETVPPTAVDRYGNPGYLLRNKLGDLYQVSAFEGVRRARGEGMIWGRSGSLLSHNLPIKWGGDSNSTWEGMKTAFRAALTASMSGAIFCAYDIGGFAGKPDKDLFLRWTASAALFSYFKLQGTTEREPWAYDQDAVDAFRELAQLRYSLMPYILDEARKSVDSFVPLARPLVLAFPGDPNAVFIDDEFMLGSSILVAPIFSESGRRKIYLPPGKWIYFYDNQEYEGEKWITKEEGMNRIPFFVLKGSKIKMWHGTGLSLEDYRKLETVERSF